MDKMRGRGRQKMSVFIHIQSMKTVNAGGGGQKLTKFCPRSFWMTPYAESKPKIDKRPIFVFTFLTEKSKIDTQHAPYCVIGDRMLWFDFLAIVSWKMKLWHYFCYFKREQLTPTFFHSQKTKNKKILSFFPLHW